MQCGGKSTTERDRFATGRDPQRERVAPRDERERKHFADGVTRVKRLEGRKTRALMEKRGRSQLFAE